MRRGRAALRTLLMHLHRVGSSCPYGKLLESPMLLPHAVLFIAGLLGCGHPCLPPSLTRCCLRGHGISTLVGLQRLALEVTECYHANVP